MTNERKDKKMRVDERVDDCDLETPQELNTQDEDEWIDECIDAINSACINKSGMEAVCVANVIRYIWRYESKNGLEDVKKARWHLDRLLMHIAKREKEKKKHKRGAKK